MLRAAGGGGAAAPSGKVLRGSRRVPTTANNDDVVSLPRCGVTPRRPQTLMAGDCIPRQRQNRIAHRSDPCRWNLAIERGLPLPFGERAGIAVPVVVLELEVVR